MPSKQVTSCRSCGAPIVWLATAAGKRIPADAETVTAGDTQFEKAAGHISHFATCPEAKTWRNPR